MIKRRNKKCSKPSKKYTNSISNAQSKKKSSSIRASCNQASCSFSINEKKIGCIGAGYVGGPMMAVMAKHCLDREFYVSDANHKRIAQWNSTTLPLFEPGLEEIVKNHRNKNLFFINDIKELIQKCDVIFIAVNTDLKIEGMYKGKTVDLSKVEAVARLIGFHSTSSKLIVIKATVAVHTGEKTYDFLNYFCAPNIRFSVVSNPEFSSEGRAIEDLENPDRVLLGGNRRDPFAIKSLKILKTLYTNWVPLNKIYLMNINSSEISKLIANAMLAQRLSSINIVSRLCELTRADIREVSKAVGSDSRIGSRYLQASPGFGGNCLEKDTLCLAFTYELNGLYEESEYWKSITKFNKLQKHHFVEKIIATLFNNTRNKRLTGLGFAFKENTMDTRNSSALDTYLLLMQEGAEIAMYDPKVSKQTAVEVLTSHANHQKHNVNIKKQFLVKSSVKSAVADSHALLVLTKWEEFRTLDYAYIYNVMKKPAFVFDGHNLLSDLKLESIGFKVYSLGVPDADTTL